jgi:hypothetical protein
MQTFLIAALIFFEKRLWFFPFGFDSYLKSQSEKPLYLCAVFKAIFLNKNTSRNEF